MIGLPVPGGTAIVGTRWGSEQNPGWFHNLTSDPRAVVERGDERIDVVARRVPEGGEYDAIMRQADRVDVGFAKYRRRISSRAVPSSCWSRSARRRSRQADGACAVSGERPEDAYCSPPTSG